MVRRAFDENSDMPALDTVDEQLQVEAVAQLDVSTGKRGRGRPAKVRNAGTTGSGATILIHGPVTISREMLQKYHDLLDQIDALSL